MVGFVGTPAAQGTRTDTTHGLHLRTSHLQHLGRQANLAAQAKITEASARAIALASVPGATVKSEELEREHGKLIYSYDLQAAGKPGVEEVNVNAMNGKIVAIRHETPKAERQERRQEHRASSAAHRHGRSAHATTGDSTAAPRKP
jgi:hypothetical protein